MTINISLADTGPNLRPKLTVVGVGGSGGNAVNNMMHSNLEGVDFLIANTDAQALQNSKCERRIQLGIKSTKGLGAGMRPDVGREAAEEAISEISEKLEGSHMIFIAAGMGGGTGTGAAPVIAKLAREKGILTVGVVTKPFHFEGTQRMKLADKGITELQQFVDTLLIIPNQNLFRIANEKTTFADAFKMADDVLYAGVRGVTDLMVQPGLINLDFSDVKTVMSEMGKAMMGTGEASGEGRSIAAAEAAIANPLIDDVSLKGARGLIINITGGNDITLYEVDEAANRIKQEVDEKANIIYGTTCDERLDGIIRVSIVATGIDASISQIPESTSQQNQASLSIDNSVYMHKNDQETPENNAVNSNNSINQDMPSIIEETIKDNNLNHSYKDEIPIADNINLERTSEHHIVQENSDEVSLNENITDFEIKNDHNQIEIESNDQSNELPVNKNDKEEDLSEISGEEQQSSVRRLSLFDTLEDKNDALEVSQDTSELLDSSKQEPVLEENIQQIHEDSSLPDNNEEKDLLDSKDVNFNNNDISDDDINQENEEELLDIPTFLRRQAN